MACAIVLRAALHDRHRADANASGVGSALAANQTDESTSDPCHETWDTKTRHSQPDHVFPTLLVQPIPPQPPNAPSIGSVQVSRTHPCQPQPPLLGDDDLFDCRFGSFILDLPRRPLPIRCINGWRIAGRRLAGIQ